jgi:hypothetical protein
MSRVLERLCSRSSARAVFALALVTTAVAACSADTSRSNSNPEATGSISQTETKQVQLHRNSRMGRRSPPPSASPTAARPAATPDITGSVVRKPTSANWSRNGGTEIAPELTGHGLPLVKCEAYNRVYDQPYGSS